MQKDGLEDEGEVRSNAPGGIQALDTALSLLLGLAQYPGAVGVTELARATNMPITKAHRYLASFIHAGLVVQRDRSGHYDLGPAAVRIGLSAMGRNDFVNRTADALESLSVATGLTASLAVWGTHGPTLVRIEGKGNLSSPPPLGLGAVLPLLTSAAGQVFLSFLPRYHTQGQLQREVAAGPDVWGAWTDPSTPHPEVETLVERVRRERLGVNDEKRYVGVYAIAAPVLNWQSEAEVAVVLTGTNISMLDREGPACLQLKAFSESFSLTNPSNEPMSPFAATSEIKHV